jgi:hypothetical membrane protein
MTEVYIGLLIIFSIHLAYSISRYVTDDRSYGIKATGLLSFYWTIWVMGTFVRGAGLLKPCIALLLTVWATFFLVVRKKRKNANSTTLEKDSEDR